MEAPNILIVAVDGLRASALGSYGNTTFDTPSLDRFAADGFLLDACFAPAIDPKAIYRAMWQSLHPLRTRLAEQSAVTLPKLLGSAGYSTKLITDDPRIAAYEGAQDFEQAVEVSSATQEGAIANRASDASQTALAKLFAAACDLITSNEDEAAARSRQGGRPRLIWMHSRGMYGPWDAPLELQQQLLDEGDPPPVEDVAPPDFCIAEADDPDAAFRYSSAYAAQVMTLDACWNALMQALHAASDDGYWLTMLVGVRGFPLGEHRRVGGVDPRMHAEQLHVPWIVQFPNGIGRLARSGALVSHVDILPTLVDGLRMNGPQLSAAFDGNSIVPLAASPRAAWRDALISTSKAGRSIRTATWSLRQDLSGATSGAEAPASELYVRPDDRWEANDVAKLCPDDVESLTCAADELTRQLL